MKVERQWCAKMDSALGCIRVNSFQNSLDTLRLVDVKILVLPSYGSRVYIVTQVIIKMRPLTSSTQLNVR